MSSNDARADFARLNDATKILEEAGFDEHGRSLNEPADDAFEGDATRYRDYFGRGNSLDEDATFSQNAAELDDIKQAAQRDEDLAKALLESNANERPRNALERAEEADRHARELRQLAAATARQVLRTHELFSEAFTHAVNGGHWNVAQAHLLDAIKSADADHALKVACVKALAEIVSFVPGDNGSPFDGPWLAELAGIPLRSAQDLIASAHALESGIAAILVGTEYGSRKALRELAEMTPARRRAAVKAVRQYLTTYLLEHAAKKEKRQRSRNFSITELRSLALAGLNNEEGWSRLLSLDTDGGNAWLADEVDKALRQRTLSERTEARGKQTLTALKSRIRRNVG